MFAGTNISSTLTRLPLATAQCLHFVIHLILFSRFDTTNRRVDAFPVTAKIKLLSDVCDVTQQGFILSGTWSASQNT